MAVVASATDTPSTVSMFIGQCLEHCSWKHMLNAGGHALPAAAPEALVRYSCPSKDPTVVPRVSPNVESTFSKLQQEAHVECGATCGSRCSPSSFCVVLSPSKWTQSGAQGHLKCGINLPQTAAGSTCRMRGDMCFPLQSQ